MRKNTTSEEISDDANYYKRGHNQSFMKILELCHFSAGVCGVWSRALEESKRLTKNGHDVLVLSSNVVKGKKEIAPATESIGKIKIKRFPARFLGGESFMYWNFKNEALAFKPDVIITHNYRQLHTTKALSIAKKLKNKGHPCKVFLVTHAPFVEGNITRSSLAKTFVALYDSLIGPRTLNAFDKILTISHWEIPYLIKCGALQNKIRYIPNGIPEEFFTQERINEEHKILFLGRIAPKKKIETLIEAIPLVKDKNITVEIVGPTEEPYASFIKGLVSDNHLEKRVLFSKPVFKISEKIKKIDTAKIFILPSRVEGMPQSLIEAMARRKIVIGSDSIAIRDLIKNGENGYLFEFNNPRDLAKKIDAALDVKTSKIAISAQNYVRRFSWEKVIREIEDTITS
jgi:glycosyltransferase involved in cell wall biosynthesis